jgi:chromosome segregation ATPase
MLTLLNGNYEHKIINFFPKIKKVANLKQNTQIVKESNIKIHDLSDELAKLRESYETLKGEKEHLAKTKDQIERNLKDVNTKSSAQIATLQAQLVETQEKNVKLDTRIDEMKAQLNELENERANHQKLIKEYSKLEQRFEKVRTELLKYGKNQQQQQQQQHQHQQHLGTIIFYIYVKNKSVLRRFYTTLF